MVRQVESQLGPVGILVNNAGISRLQPFDQITEKDWDEVLAVNLKSVFLVTQAVLPGMRAAKWGRIINLSSVARADGRRHRAALRGVQGGHPRPDALLCLPVGQGGHHRQRHRPGADRDGHDARQPPRPPDLIPVGRLGTVDEVADVVIVLAANGYITGQTINVNGGWYMS